MLTVYLVRHAETTDNVAGRKTIGNAPINERGERQSEELGEELKDVVFSKVITSDKTRTIQTANWILSKSLGKKPEFCSLPLLREQSFGNWDLFMGRLDTFFNNLCELADTGEEQNILVVCHGLFIHSFLTKYLNGKKDKDILLEGCTQEDLDKNVENTVKSIFQIWKKEEGSLRKVNFLKVLDSSHLSVPGHGVIRNYAK